jgi:hypothetical protein
VFAIAGVLRTVEHLSFYVRAHVHDGYALAVIGGRPKWISCVVRYRGIVFELFCLLFHEIRARCEQHAYPFSFSIVVPIRC